jgi:hypothetical protein
LLDSLLQENPRELEKEEKKKFKKYGYEEKRLT